MGKEMLMFGNIGIDKNKSYRHEVTIFFGRRRY